MRTRYNGVETGSGAPSGSAGGDLAGTYPNPTVADLTISSEARGDLLRRGASAWERVALGASGRALVSDGADPQWTALTTSHVSDAGATGVELMQATSVATARGPLGLDPREDGTSPVPLLWWKLDETSGTAPANSGSLGTAALALTSAAVGALGPWGEAALQVSANGYALAPVDIARPTTALSLALWFRQSAIAAARLMIRTYQVASWSAPYTAAFLTLDGSGRLSGAIYSGGAERSASTTLVARASAWHHAVLTYDGTTVRLYLDGVQVGTASHSGTIDYGASPTLTRWCVGGNHLATAEAVLGEIADARVYDTALAAAKVAEMHRRGRGTYDG